MQNHDQLHVIKVRGTDHCGNSGCTHLTFLHFWTYPNQQGASEGTWKICNNCLSHLLFLKHHGCIQKRIIRVAGPEDSEIRGQAWSELIRTDRHLMLSPYSWVGTTKTIGSGRRSCSEDQTYALFMLLTAHGRWGDKACMSIPYVDSCSPILSACRDQTQAMWEESHPKWPFWEGLCVL